MTRDRYHDELEALQTDVVRMAAMAGDAVHASVDALKTLDAATAERIIAADDQIDALHLDLENRCMRLLALQQPMASDLRTIAAVFAITIDLERLADHAEGISRCTRRLARQPLRKPLIDIPRMEALVQEMLRDAMNAFLRHDPSLAGTMAKKDDEVDGLRSQVFRELLTFMIGDPQTTPRIYMVTGDLRELNV